MHLCRKSWLSLLLSFCLMFQLFAVFHARPAAALSSNLVANPGFEEVAGGVPAHWSAMGSAWGGAIKVAPEAARTGNYGVSIHTTTRNNPWVAIPVPVEEGATYNITSWFKAIGVSGNVGYKLEFFKGIENTVENWVTGYSYLAARSANDGQWHELEYTVQVPKESAYMYVYLRLYGTGTVYFDDVTAVKTKDKPQIVIEPSQRYFYPDVTNGSALIAIEPSDGILAGKTVDVRIVDQASGLPIFEQNGIAAAAAVNIAFPTTGMLLEQPYQLEVELKDGAGQLIELEACELHRWERPGALPQNGSMLVDGQPFFPVIAYHAYPEDYHYLKEIGVNTIQGTNNGSEASMQVMLDTAHASGLKVLVPLYLDMRVKENFELTRQLVTRFKNHPAVLGYMIMDEPSGNGIPQSELLDAYKLIRSIDPFHPTYMVEADLHYYRSIGQATDILVTDVYPYNLDNNQPISAVGDGVRKAIADVDNTKHVWTVLQTFKLDGTIWNYLPTIDQLRNMAYQAFLAGSKGLGYYSINDPGWKLRESALWPGLVDFKDELALIGDLVSTGNKAAEHIGSDVQWAIYTKGQERYAVAINLTNQTQTATLPFAQAGNQVELLYGAAPEKSNNWEQALSVSLGPEQTLVYRITPLTAGVDQAIGELQDSTTLIANNQWKKKTEKLIEELLKVKQELMASSVNVVKVMNRTEKALDNALELKNWISGKSDLVLEGKRAPLNALLDDVIANILPILQSMARLELHAAVASVVQGDELALSAAVYNAGDKAIQDVRLRIELPEAMGVSPIEQQFGKIKRGQSASHSVSPAIPATMQPGDYVAKAFLTFNYKGTDIQVSAERDFTVAPLLAAKLAPERMDVTMAGVYPFSVELTNHANGPITVALERTTAGGITVNLPGTETLAGHETKTVQGTVTVPAEAVRGDYTVTVEPKVAGVSYGSLPLALSVDTNPVYNGGFERAAAGESRPDGWHMRAGVWDKTSAHSGQASAKLMPDANNVFNVLNTESSRQFPLVAGSKYKLTGWVKTEATAGSVALGIRQIDIGGATTAYTWTEAAKTGEWEKVEVTFTALPNTKHGTVYFKLDQAANGAAWVDDVELSEVVTVLDAQLTPNTMDVSQEGTYPFTVELTNGTNNPITVDLPLTSPSGITVTLDSSVVLAARETKTVQGSVHVPSPVTKGVYAITIEAKVGNISYATLPLEVNIDTNLVYNSSFENMSVGWARPDGWSMRAAVWDQTVARTGQYSAKLVPDANNAFNVLNTDSPKAIAVTPGQQYLLEGWVKNSATAGSVALGIRQVDANGGTTSYVWTEAPQLNDWTKVEVAFTALPQTATVWIYFKLDQAANGAAWLDDLELSKVSP